MTPNALIIHKIKKIFKNQARNAPFTLGFGILDPSNARAMIGEGIFILTKNSLIIQGFVKNPQNGLIFT